MTMTVTRDVVKDLVTVYLAGEASEDTRSLVEEYLRSDPALAREVEAVRAGTTGLPAVSAPDPTREKRALEATRQQLKHRTSTLAMAVLFTLLPFSFVFKDSRVTFLIIRDAPVIGLAWWATAAVMWAWHVSIRRRLRVSGL
jgi:anti-sigma factor RsiW